MIIHPAARHLYKKKYIKPQPKRNFNWNMWWKIRDGKTFYNNRGLLFEAEELYWFAKQDYSRAIEINPIYKDAYNNRERVIKLLQKNSRLNTLPKLLLTEKMKIPEFRKDLKLPDIKTLQVRPAMKLNKLTDFKVKLQKAGGSRPKKPQ